MKDVCGMSADERKSFFINKAFEMTKSMLFPTMRIYRSRRNNQSLEGHRIVANVIYQGEKDGCSWPNEEIFLFGGHGIMSVFDLIDTYCDNSYDDIWRNIARKLARFTVFSKYKSVEELVLAIEIAGEMHK